MKAAYWYKLQDTIFLLEYTNTHRRVGVQSGHRALPTVVHLSCKLLGTPRGGKEHDHTTHRWSTETSSPSSSGAHEAEPER